MSHITTVSGKHFDPIEPDEKLIDIKDIAHALSMICRGNGHTKIFYSVAQHSIACALEAEARGWSDEVILGCLLHDASEAYLSDVTRPVKKDLPYYLKVEDRLQNILWEHFIGRPITKEEKTQIFKIDDLMFSMEFHQIMAEDANEDYKKLVRDFVCKYTPQEEMQELFIKVFKKYNEKICE